MQPRVPRHCTPLQLGSVWHSPVVVSQRALAPQAVAHLSIGLEAALGDRQVPRLFIGRLIGGSLRAFAEALRDDMVKTARESGVGRKP